MTTSHEWFEKAKEVIPGGVNSPVRAFRHVGMEPLYFARAEGPYLYDTEGKRYVDFCMAFGPHILGHSPKPVVDALKVQLERGTSFGTCHPKEIELSQTILRAYPFLHKVRLVNSGTEAVMTAVRLARGATNRNKILKFEGCYHGHLDSLLCKAGSGVAELSEATSAGVPASYVNDTITARYDDLDSIKRVLEQHRGEIAAAIWEPIPANYGLWVPPHAHVKAVFEMVKAEGALVIFDEVITGFRVGLGGAVAFYDLCPDLVTLGKVIGGGLPLAAVVGRAPLMDQLAPLGQVYQAGTFSGNVLAVSSGLAMLEALFEKRPELLKFDNQAEAFAKELEEVVRMWGEAQVVSLGSIFWIHFGKPTKSFPPEITPEAAKQYAEFYRAALSAGVYFAPSPYEVGFVSFAHTEAVLQEVLKKLKLCSKSE